MSLAQQERLSNVNGFYVITKVETLGGWFKGGEKTEHGNKNISGQTERFI